MQTLTHEEWLPIAGHVGYEVSNLGRVRSLDRWISPKGGAASYFRRGCELTPRWSRPGGYLIVTLSNRATARVHRLVAEAFLSGREDGYEVCHNNGDTADNAAHNLRWDTHSANLRDKVNHGKHHNANKTHCLRGHKLSGGNIAGSREGRRDCRQCMSDRERLRGR